MGLSTGRFLKDTRRFDRLGLDSALLIYHLADIEPYSALTEVVFSAVASGSSSAILSTISLTELLVKPLAQGRVEAVETF